MFFSQQSIYYRLWNDLLLDVFVKCVLLTLQHHLFWPTWPEVATWYICLTNICHKSHSRWTNFTVSCASVISIQQDRRSELTFAQLWLWGHAHSANRNSTSVYLEMKKLFITHVRTVMLHPLLQLSVEQFHWMDGKWDSNLTSVSIQRCRFVVLMSTGSLLDVENLQAVCF